MLSHLTRLYLAALAVLLLSNNLYAQENAVETRLRRDLAYLASDACEGRGPGTKGIDLAAAYIAKEFKEAGLKAAGPDGYFQPFTVSGDARKAGPSTLRLRGPLGQEIELREGKDFEALGLSGAGKVTAPIVFVGFGTTVKEKYDDYKDIDVKGKVVLMLRHMPRWKNKEAPLVENADEYAALVKKQSLAEANHAAAVLLVNDRIELANQDKLVPFDDLARQSSSGSIPSLHIRRNVADMMLRNTMLTGLSEMEAAIDAELTPRSAPLSGWTAHIEANVERTKIPVKNVVGMLEGAGPLAKETVIIGAHYDHLGYGGRNSLSEKSNKKEIHNGADDNASGTSALLELARVFGAEKDRQGRRLVFMAFSAEEIGLLGSRHYCEKQPLFPLADTVAMVNLDMVGRMEPDKKTKKGVLIVEGIGTAKGFKDLVEATAKDFPFQVVKKESGYGPSDHESFYRQKVPVLFLFTGTHKDYHRPSDTAEKINYADMVTITGLAERLVQTLATETRRPEYVHVAAQPQQRNYGGMPKLGIMPNYGSEEKGLLIGGVPDGTAAAKAGLKPGDLITEIAGKQVTNIQTYMTIMTQQRPGQPLSIVVLREGKRLTLKAVPQ